MFGQPNRAAPRLGAHEMKTYEVKAPASTHFRPATCAEYGCDAHRLGWTSTIDERTDLGQQQAHYIRKSSGRRFLEERNELGLTVFTFEAGQTCFARSPHTVRLDRPELYVVRDGDWRGNPRGTQARVHANASDWVDDFAEHQDGIASAIQRG